jgi:lysophospholipase L1-like esterase
VLDEDSFAPTALVHDAQDEAALSCSQSCANGVCFQNLIGCWRLDKDVGNLYEGVSVDGLHLYLKGYQVWADALKPILTELLGPPVKEDHAPSPTGDPSAGASFR